MTVNAQALRRYEKAVALRVAEPSGYRRNHFAMYWHESNGTITGFELQRSRYGEAYFVNVAIHYTIVPTFFSKQQPVGDKMHLLDYFVHGRAHELDPEMPIEFLYGESKSESIKILGGAMSKAIMILYRLRGLVGSIDVLIGLLSPQLLRTELPRCLTAPDILQATEAKKHSEISRILGGFSYDMSKLALALAAGAAQQGNCVMAKEYLEIAKAMEARWGGQPVDIIAKIESKIKGLNI